MYENYKPKQRKSVEKGVKKCVKKGVKKLDKHLWMKKLKQKV